MSPTEPQYEQQRQQTGFSGGWTDPNAGYVDQNAENERIVTEDPEGDGTANTSIYLWNPNALNTQGLFPKRFPSTVASMQDLIKLVRDDMSYQERQAFKRKLWAAGFYGDKFSPGAIAETGEVGYEFGSSLKGNWDDGNANDSNALQALFNRYAEDNKNVGRTGQALDLDTIFSEKLLEQSGKTREELIGNYDLQGLTLALQEFAATNLDRQFTEEELQGLLQKTFAFDQEPGEKSASTASWAARNTTADPLTKQQIVIGGGPDSSAINFGRGLASTYNLVVDTAFTTTPKMFGATQEFEEAFQEGRAVKIVGDRQRMIMLHEWANTQKTDNGVFENVRFVYETNSNEPTGLLLSMREGKQIPPMAMTGFSFGQTGSEMDKFLDSVKRPGEVYAYSWEGDGPNRRGAYGMSDQIWEFYTNQIGLDSGDTSITAQNRVARAYVTDLWSRYGSWTEVALALRVNEDTANRRAAERQAQGAGYVDVVTDPSDLSWANAAVAKMGEWKPVLDAQNSKDLYSSMYGENTNYVPMNVFAGTPSTPTGAKNKALLQAARDYRSEINTSKIMQDVMKMAANGSLPDFSKLERKW
jgi:hypothetical protein